MWHDIVSFSHTALNQAIFRFVDLFWRHPLIAALFVAVFIALTLLLWIEVIKEITSGYEPVNQSLDVRPLRLRR